MNIRDELKDKLENFINSRISKEELYEWALNCIYEDKDEPQDKREEVLFREIFGDLIELNEPEWCDLTPEKLKYLYDCLTNKEEFNVEKAMGLNKRNIKRL